MIIAAIFFCAIVMFSTSLKLIGGGSSTAPASSCSVNSIVETTTKSCQSISANAMRSASAWSSSSCWRDCSHLTHSARSLASARTSRRPTESASPESAAARPARRSRRVRVS